MQWKSSSSRTPRSSCRTRSQHSSRRIIATATGISWSSSARSYETSRIAKIPEFCLWWIHSEEFHRRSENYYGIIWKTSRTTEWSKFHEWFQGFYGCWVDLQWKSTRYQSTLVVPWTSSIWRDVEAFVLFAATKWGAAKYLGYIRYIRKRFCTTTSFFVSSVSSGIEFHLEENYRGTNPHVYCREVERPERDSDLRCQSGPSGKDSVIFSGGDSSKNYGADQQRLQISDLHFWQIPYTSYVCLLEDKIQHRGLYLFTISYGSNAVDQRSGVGWFSGRFEIFVIYS